MLVLAMVFSLFTGNIGINLFSGNVNNANMAYPYVLETFYVSNGTM